MVSLIIHAAQRTYCSKREHIEKIGCLETLLTLFKETTMIGQKKVFVEF